MKCFFRLNILISAEFMDSSAPPDVLNIRGKCSPTAKNVLLNIKSFDESVVVEHDEIETFEATNMSMLCLKCSNYVNLKGLRDHRALHEALALFQYDFEAKPTSAQELSRKRAALIKDLNERLDISRSAYSRKLGRIDLAYEVVKSAIYGRSNKVKPPFIEHHDVIIRSNSAKMTNGVALGASESTNEEWRSEMEDAYSFKYEFSKGRTISYFAVFDGYGGVTAAKQCADQFYQILKETLSDFKVSKCIEDTHCQLFDFQQAFDNMDKVLLYGANETSRNRWSGCSATTCMIVDDTLHVANVGNVKAALIKDDGSFKTLTDDHSPANKKEKHRIKANGDIHKWSKTVWVNGVVMTTRGLGNHGDPILKSGIVNVPAVCCVPLENVQIILIASHGFWEVFDENEAVYLIKDWLKQNVSMLGGGVRNSVNSSEINCSSPIEIVIQNEGSLRTESLDIINEPSEDLAGSDMSEQDSNCDTVLQPDEQDLAEESLLSDLIRKIVKRYDVDCVAVEISKHLTRAALTTCAKDNITVMTIIPCTGSNDDKIQ